MSGDGPSTGIPDAGVDVFAGHLGHLSPDQDRAFAAFKKALTDAGLYTPPIERDGAVEKPASHDDITLFDPSIPDFIMPVISPRRRDSNRV